jgi:16S rRNA (uracil1498-N3)-methyltransferase
MKKRLFREFLRRDVRRPLESHKTLAELCGLGLLDAAEHLLKLRPHLLRDRLCVPLTNAPDAYLRKAGGGQEHALESKMNLFVDHVDEVQASVSLPDSCVRHVKARRLSAGAMVTLVDGKGWLFFGRLIERNRVAIEARRFVPPPRVRLVLASAVPDETSRLETLVAKAAELGADVFQPLICLRSVRGDKFDAARLGRIAIASMEQSERAHAMQIREPLRLATFLQNHRPRGVFGHLGKCDPLRPIKSKTVLQEHGDVTFIRAECSVCVGPEGGFTDEEIRMLVESRLTPMSFGDAILRVETAGIAGVAIVRNVFEIKR